MNYFWLSYYTWKKNAFFCGILQKYNVQHYHFGNSDFLYFTEITQASLVTVKLHFSVISYTSLLSICLSVHLSVCVYLSICHKTCSDYLSKTTGAISGMISIKCCCTYHHHFTFHWFLSELWPFLWFLWLNDFWLSYGPWMKKKVFLWYPSNVQCLASSVG